jgi:DNA-binding response OmpR family regulator
VPGDRIEHRHRLVQHQQPRPAGQRQGQRELSLLPAGQLPGPPLRAPAAVPVIVRGDIVFDRARRRVSRAGRAGRALSLTRKEMGILEELLVADGGVISTEDLLERVWDENTDPFTRTVTVTIGRLRRKLGEPDPIDTVTGSGYRLP